MRKRDLLIGIYGVYAVFDKVSKHYKSIHFASNDEDFVRTQLPSVILSTPLRDLQIFKIGSFNDVTGDIKSSVKKRVSTDCYLFPHSMLSPVGENVSLETLENQLNEVKNQIIANSSESDSDENKTISEAE